MFAHRSLTTLATFMALGGIAHAEILAGGPVYAGNLAGATVACQLFNYGTVAVAINSPGIYINGGNASLPLTANTCTAALAPTGFCQFTATTVGNVVYLCRLNANGLDVRLTGVAQIQNGTTILATQPIHK